MQVFEGKEQQYSSASDAGSDSGSNAVEESQRARMLALLEARCAAAMMGSSLPVASTSRTTLDSNGEDEDDGESADEDMDSDENEDEEEEEEWAGIEDVDSHERHAPAVVVFDSNRERVRRDTLGDTALQGGRDSFMVGIDVCVNKLARRKSSHLARPGSLLKSATMCPSKHPQTAERVKGAAHRRAKRLQRRRASI